MQAAALHSYTGMNDKYMIYNLKTVLLHRPHSGVSLWDVWQETLPWAGLEFRRMGGKGSGGGRRWHGKRLAGGRGYGRDGIVCPGPGLGGLGRQSQSASACC